jgi:hypothetical protein
VDMAGVTAERGGEGGGCERERGWCLVRIHSGPKCMVVVDICIL